ncbi:MAG: PaaI family thioesterase [Desulfuromonadales bacterium]|nr:PaaI family thioesterase [Desulfuromonadales bacterium]
MLRHVKKMIESGHPPMPIASLLDFKIKSAQLGQAVIELTMVDDHTNSMGTLHGGVICTIADTAMGVAFFTMLEKGESLTTLDLNINFLRPVWNGKLLEVAKVVKKGKVTGFVECDVVDESEQLVARASSTYMTLTDDRARRRMVPGLTEV